MAKKTEISKVVQKVMELKIFLQPLVDKYPATYHAADVVSRIVGWEEYAMSDKKFDFPKKVKQIYLESAD